MMPPPPPPPPEKEHVESEFQAPVATGRFVWIANPSSGHVSLVDATTLAVRTVDAGDAPTYLAEVPGGADDTTVVLNVVSNDATLLHAEGGGISTMTLKTVSGANAWAFAKNGRFAVAWADASRTPNAPKTAGFQDIALLDFVLSTSTPLAVGYRPVSISFAADGKKAYAVTEDGITVIDAAASPPRVTASVDIADDPAEDPKARHVIVSPDGAYAFVRRDASAVVTAIALSDGTKTPITLPGDLTDLGISDAGDKLVAVVRPTSQVVILPVPTIVGAPNAFTALTVSGETIGSVTLAPGGNAGVVYTSAMPTERIAVLNLGQTPAFRAVHLHSPVLAVFAAPDAANAVVLHDTSGMPDTFGAFSVVPLAANLPVKIQQTQAPPTAVAMTSNRAVVAERDDMRGVNGVYLVHMPELSVARVAIASPIKSVGIVPMAKRAYVAQEHPQGRITFVDLETSLAQTLTGFELAARVVDGSQP
jgi:hypothetical protein